MQPDFRDPPLLILQFACTYVGSGGRSGRGKKGKPGSKGGSRGSTPPLTLID